MQRKMQPIVRLASMIGGPLLTELITWFQSQLNRHEEIEIDWWTDNFWYVCVRDARRKEPTEGLLMGLTIDVQEDRIFWAHEDTYAGLGFSNGGNCFCRSERWWRKLKVYFAGKVTSDRHDKKGTVRDYRRRKTG